MDIDYESDPVALAATRPDFFETPGLNRLFAMFVALGEQLAVTNERHDTLQRILIDKEVLSAEDISSYIVSPEAEKERIAQHQAMVGNILAVIDDELKGLRKD